MRYAEYPPCTALTPHVKCYWVFEADADRSGAAPEAIVPDGSSELIFHLGDPFERLDAAGRVVTQHRSVFVGQLERAMTVRPTGRRALFAVRFRPAGAAAFFGGAARGFSGQSVALRDAWPRMAERLADHVAAAQDDLSRIAVVERALLARLVVPRAAPLAAVAAGRILACGGALRIDDLADDLGVSARTLGRAFDETVGIAPKTLARIARLRRALALLESPRPASLASVAFGCGYADQSHLVREFRALTGAPPTVYLAAERPLADHFGA